MSLPSLELCMIFYCSGVVSGIIFGLFIHVRLNKELRRRGKL
jgi:hypothetical protein